MPREPCVYILASRPHGAIYAGVTSDLARRVWQHKRGEGSAFTRHYQIDKSVWMEAHETMDEAIAREKQIKRWSKARRRGLIDVFQSRVARSLLRLGVTGGRPCVASVRDSARYPRRSAGMTELQFVRRSETATLTSYRAFRDSALIEHRSARVDCLAQVRVPDRSPPSTLLTGSPHRLQPTETGDRP